VSKAKGRDHVDVSESRVDVIAAMTVGPVAYAKYYATGVRGQETVRDDLKFPGIECTAEEDKARQEYALQSEIGYQIQRFGVGHPLQFGSVDYDSMDLTKAMALLEEAQTAWLSLPAVIRDRYQSWANVEAAAASGELEQVLKAAGVSAAVADASGASPSESAAGKGAEPPKGS